MQWRPKATDARKLGEWRFIERDMAAWARQRGVKRRTDQQCRRRYSQVEPEKYDEHIAVRQPGNCCKRDVVRVRVRTRRRMEWNRLRRASFFLFFFVFGHKTHRPRKRYRSVLRITHNRGRILAWSILAVLTAIRQLFFRMTVPYNCT